MDDAAARELVARIDALLERAGEPATELVAALLELYGEGLARVLAAVPADAAVALAGDELVGHLLLLHDLHPMPLDARVRGALDDVRPYLESHGGDVELLAIGDGAVRLRLRGSCDGCPSSSATLKLAIEDAIAAAAPEVERVEAEGAVSPSPPLLQVETVGPAAPRRSWTEARVPELAVGERAGLEVDGERLLLVRLERRLYAYRPVCPSCGEDVEDGALDGSRLTCPGCGAVFDLRRAGRAPAGGAPLEPVPLLTAADGAVKLALRAGVAA